MAFYEPQRMEQKPQFSANAIIMLASQQKKSIQLPSWAESNQRAYGWVSVLVAVLFHCKIFAAQSDCCVQVGNLTAQFS